MGKKSLSALEGKAEKRARLEEILQQYDIVEKESKKLCDSLSTVAGVNVHETQWRGIPNESTLILHMRLRGGMMRKESGRNDYDCVAAPDEESEMRELEARLEEAAKRVAELEKMKELYIAHIS